MIISDTKDYVCFYSKAKLNISIPENEALISDSRLGTEAPKNCESWPGDGCVTETCAVSVALGWPGVLCFVPRRDGRGTERCTSELGTVVWLGRWSLSHWHVGLCLSFPPFGKRTNKRGWRADGRHGTRWHYTHGTRSDVA